MSCPCGSKLDYSDCCEPLHKGSAKAQTAEALMRSRYSAFVKKQQQYLLDTWHSSTRPQTMDLSNDETWWLGLEILHSEQTIVEFVASYRGGKLHERSNFLRENDQWFYVDGMLKSST